MATKMRLSTKRLQIDKANTTIVIAVGVAAFVTAFALVSARSLLARRSYQARVITAQEKARDQLKENIEAVDDLKEKYQEFVTRQENIIKGNSAGNGERDGDNAKIILDALPSKYDFPALASSLEKIEKDRNYVVTSLSGIDDEAVHNSSGLPTDSSATGVTTTTPTAAPQTAGASVEMPYELGAKGSYDSMVKLLQAFRDSIRPLHVQQLVFTADEEGTLELVIKGKSYYQPEQTLKIESEVVQ
jgi:hypothetical protein